MESKWKQAGHAAGALQPKQQQLQQWQKRDQLSLAAKLFKHAA
jgi:hypothetical protein